MRSAKLHECDDDGLRKISLFSCIENFHLICTCNSLTRSNVDLVTILSSLLRMCAQDVDPLSRNPFCFRIVFALISGHRALTTVSEIYDRLSIIMRAIMLRRRLYRADAKRGIHGSGHAAYAVRGSNYRARESRLHD